MKCAIVDFRISEKMERSLLIGGFQVIKLPPSPTLSEAVCAHADMLAFHHEKRIIASGAYCEKFPIPFTDMREYAPDVEIYFSEDVHSFKYPNDAIFNALVIGERIFMKTDTVSKSVIDYAKNQGLKIVHTKQGYPACTTLAFGNSAITADEGMAKILRSEGITVTKVSNGDILLPPHEYGFIGGAAGIWQDKIYFLGDINTHRDSEKITRAIKDAGYTPISLSDEPLRDLGRIIFID